MLKFKITEEEVEVLIVTVLEGRGISVGTLSDMVDKPDPYVKLRVAGSPNAMQRTKPIANEVNPKWNAEFKFFLVKERKLEIIVMDEDLGFDDTIGIASYDFSQLKLGEPVHHTFQFKEKTFVDVKMVLEIDDSKQLRYSDDLCDEEKNFLKLRKENTWKGMKKFLGDEKEPKQIDEVPVIAVMGSGGGFRAMCGLSGVFNALEEAGFLDCTTYVSGLSGSSWYISTLYSNSGWPNGCSCEDISKEIEDRVDTSFLRLLTPLNLLKYHKEINRKKCLGYPVSFTDFFGCLVGDTLLQDKAFKLTYFKNKVNHGDVPLPLCTAVHVEKDVSAQVFSEWVEFSPYEVGLCKYGVFVKTEHFGAKFYKGRMIRYNTEQPLHYLQGMWGSAFTILFQRLLHENNEPKAPKGAKDDGRADLKKFVSSDEIKHKNEESDSDDEAETDDEDNADGRENGKENERPGVLSKIGRTLSFPFVWIYNAISGKQQVHPTTTRKPIKHKTKEKDEPFWKDWIDGIVNSIGFTRTREGRAAEVHNMFRGLKIERLEAGDHSQIVSSTVKNTFLVDGGLDFNSPYPLMLRPQRNVDIILSFDFSQRDKDNTPAFTELLLAEKWAKEENLPFPPVASDPQINDADVKELYVFEDSNDINCPIVMHFVLLNKTFKEFKEPGIPRETEEEKSFGNFSIFDDKDEPYSSFTFDYTHRTYERLCKLMKFNTLLNLDVIKEKLANRIESRRNNPPAAN